ncbi:hypothetical protein WJX74_008218 [Apatococcus lobatus]|uniref:Uncharacterized protein n=1 Tax=Apatococcus lobatus TaxID=904363 RepID=A0AAW1S127_9CHLO
MFQELVLQDLTVHSGPGTAGLSSVFKQMMESFHRRTRSRSLQPKRKERLAWRIPTAQGISLHRCFPLHQDLSYQQTRASQDAPLINFWHCVYEYWDTLFSGCFSQSCWLIQYE